MFLLGVMVGLALVFSIFAVGLSVVALVGVWQLDRENKRV
jgi:hypothetical protein